MSVIKIISFSGQEVKGIKLGLSFKEFVSNLAKFYVGLEREQRD